MRVDVICHFPFVLIFFSSENIFGYQDLEIDFWMCASSLKTYINVKYAEKIDKDKSGGIEADPVLEPLLKILWFWIENKV